MSTDDHDDPGADTAMFRAYVEHPEVDPAAAPAANRTLVIAIVVALAVLVLLGVLIVAA